MKLNTEISKENKEINEKISHMKKTLKDVSKKKRRKEILLNCLKYLSSNGIKLSDYLTQKEFPSRPFELRGSEEFFDAVKFYDIDIINQALKRSDLYLEQYDYFLQTPIHWAAKLGNVELLKQFLRLTKKINVYDRKHRTPLYIAALNNQRECVELLLEYGGNAYLADIDGNKPENVTEDVNIKVILQTTSEKPFTELIKINVPEPTPNSN